MPKRNWVYLRDSTYRGGAMKRKELARELAKQQGVPEAEARDRVDQMVHDILQKLKQGKPVRLPGIGKLVARPAPSK